jgi:hypothetical protein
LEAAGGGIDWYLTLDCRGVIISEDRAEHRGERKGRREEYRMGEKGAGQEDIVVQRKPGTPPIYKSLLSH